MSTIMYSIDWDIVWIRSGTLLSACCSVEGCRLSEISLHKLKKHNTSAFTYQFALDFLSPFPCLNLFWKEMRCYKKYSNKTCLFVLWSLFLSLVTIFVSFSHSFCIWDCCILSSSFHPCLMVFLKLFWKLIVEFIILIPILSSSKMNRDCLFLQKAAKSTDCENFAATLLWSFL